jgi:hypothetical protein
LIHAVLDTNVYRSNPDRNNLNFKAIERLSTANLLKLHIPYVVEREFQTQQREIYSKSLSKALSALSGLLRKKISPEIIEKIESLKNEIESESDKILSDAENQIIQWFHTIDADRHPLCIEQTISALEAYFQGKPPLKSIKVREDIPDSFIVQAIKKISLNTNRLHIVAGDKKVREAFSDNESVVVYESLSDFVESKIIQNELQDLDLIENIDKYVRAIEEFEDDYAEISSNIANAIGEAIISETISSPSIPDDNNEATINSYSEAENIKFDFSEISYYGSGQFGIPFSLNISLNAIYYIFKADYYCMDHEREKVPSVSDHNDHYFEAEDEFTVEVRGVATISINRDDINFEDFSECVDYESIGIDNIESIELC